MNIHRLRRRAAMLAIMACAATLALTAARGGDNPAQAAAVVRLVIDYGDGVEKHYTALPWREGMTVRAALDAAHAMPPPRGLAYLSKGDGERTLLTSLDGVANEGGAKGTRNWLFWVNGKPGEASFAVSTLKPGDTATWRFDTYDALVPKQ